MKIILKDGSVKEYAEAKLVLDIAKDVSEGLARVACAGEVDGERVDSRTVIDKDCTLNILTFEDKRGRDAFRRTASHIMTQAIKRLYLEVRLAISPSIDDGFYYDLDIETPITTEDFPAIEAEMKEIAKEDLSLEHFELPREDAIRFFREKNEPYKVELIQDLPEDAVISLYRQGGFTDLCAGPHLMSTKPVKAIKLMENAGTYWRGDEKNKMLIRIYGTAYTKNAGLEEYVTMPEEMKKRDHRKLGKELDLFMLIDEGPGFPFFPPKGMVLRNTLTQYWREIHERGGYVEVSTPVTLNRQLWKTPDHWDHYKENMHTTAADGEDFAIKPMNCPGGILVYKSQPHSYRELPLRLIEVGLVHRHEKSSAPHNPMRARCFNQDDAHIFTTPEQIRDEVKGAVRLIDEVYRLFGFKYFIELSTRPKDSMRSDGDQEMVTNGLRDAPEDMGLGYIVNEGDGAFYGSKIDFYLVDTTGRTWQCGTIQLDFQLPQRLEAEYNGADEEIHWPIMVHRVCFSSIRRFIGILMGHSAGKFPTWLVPMQVKVPPISDKYLDYGHQVMSRLKAAGICCETGDRAEKIDYRIREVRDERVLYTLVVGQKEEEGGPASVRSCHEGNKGQKEIDAFISAVRQEIDTRERQEERAVEETKQ